MLNHYRSILTMLSMLFILAACADGGEDNYNPPKPIKLQITSTVNTLAAGDNTVLTADLFYDDGTTLDSIPAIWESMNPEVATVGRDNGIVTGIAPGKAIIKSTVKELSEEVTATITDARLDSISITPASSVIAIGEDKQFKATGTFSDGSSYEITDSAGIEWISSAPDIASIDASTGNSKGLNKGSTTISATRDGITSTPNSTLTVSGANLLNITISPNFVSQPKGTTYQFTAKGFYSDNSEKDITSQVVWHSSNTDVVKFLEAEKAMAKGYAVGESVITATLNNSINSDNQAEFTVTHAKLKSFNIAGEDSLPLGKSTPWSATAVFTGDEEHDVTGSKQVFWQSSDTSVATVTLSGEVKGISEGKATISAKTSFSNFEDSREINITPKEIESLYIRDLSGSGSGSGIEIISEGKELQLDVIGRYTDGSIDENIEKSPYFKWIYELGLQPPHTDIRDDSYFPEINLAQETGGFQYEKSNGFPSRFLARARYKENEISLESSFYIFLQSPKKISLKNVEFIGVLTESESNSLYIMHTGSSSELILNKLYYPFILMTQTQAKTYCENLIYNNNNDWRLPTSEELIALWNNEDGTDDSVYFEQGWVFSHNYWSGTRSGTKFKSVSLSSGAESDTSGDTPLYVSCVRDL